MSGGTSAGLSLPLLQNKIKKNSKGYVSEFRQQLRSYEAQLSIFALSPPKDSKEFGRLVTFLSQVAYLYPEDSQGFAQSLMDLLEKSYATMDADLRKTIFQALVLIRNRGHLDPVPLITLCFHLFRCKDKLLRQMIFMHIISDIRNVNKKASNLKLNKSIQNVVFSMLDDPSTIAAKKSLQVMVELYKRRVWVDPRTVNMIAQACLSNQPKNVAIGLQFFLGIEEKIDALLEEEEEEQKLESLTAKTGKTAKEIQKSKKLYSKKTRSRMRRLQKEAKALKRSQIAKHKDTAEFRRAFGPRFPAIELINDPQGFAEQLFKKLKTSNDHFEVRLLMMNLVSRVIGYHKLVILSFYTYIQKYLQPHQRHVTNMLAYLIQASHELVPAEDLEPTFKHIANAFVSDRSGPEVMAVGLNSLRELVTKVPLLTTGEGMDDLLQDLVQYKSYKRDKSVVMAARSFLNLLREVNPAILERKDRGKFHNANPDLLEYGQIKLNEGVDGAILLQYLEEEAERKAKKRAEGGENDDDDGDDDDEEGDEDEGGEEEGDDDDDDDEGDDKKMEQDNENLENEDEDELEEEEEATTLLEKTKKRKIEQKDRIDAKRFLTEEDFDRIRKLKQKLEKEKFDPRARRKKEKETQKKAKRNDLLEKLAKQGYEVIGAEGYGEQESEDDDPFASDDESENSSDEEGEGILDQVTVDPSNLEGVVKRRRRELAERIAAIQEGKRAEHRLTKERAAGTSNKQKDKHKPYLMVKESTRVKQKQLGSLRQQQLQLKQHIKTLEKNKKTLQKIRRKNK